MTLGVRNPFKTETKSKKKPMETVYDGINTESPRQEPPTVTMDGGRYSIQVAKATSAKEAALAILKFFHALSGSDSIRAKDLGVHCISPGIDTPEEGCLILRYDNLALSIYVAENKTPESAYRRIAYAIQGLYKKDLQKIHGITVVERM